MKNLQTLKNLLKEKSQQLNLFSAKDRELLEEKHFPDALAVMDFWQIEDEMRVLDLGTGGGIPGLPLAVSCPNAEFTLCDARQKKMDAMDEIKHELELENVTIISGRFEILAQLPDFREQFDIVLARAVAPLPTLLEYVSGFLGVGGKFYAWKGSDFQSELDSSKNALEALEMSFVQSFDYELPSGEKRVILEFEKIGRLDFKYPRRDGVPKSKPL